MNHIVITYTARKDNRYDKCFKACVWVNGKSQYHTERGKKSVRGAINAARRVAEDVAAWYTSQNVTKTIYDVTIQEVRDNQ